MRAGLGRNRAHSGRPKTDRAADHQTPLLLRRRVVGHLPTGLRPQEGLRDGAGQLPKQDLQDARQSLAEPCREIPPGIKRQKNRGNFEKGHKTAVKRSERQRRPMLYCTLSKTARKHRAVLCYSERKEVAE